jgi:peptidylprolyl isomerase
MKKTLLFLLLVIGSIGSSNSQTVVTFYTSMGDFEVQLYDAERPITVGNFLSLVEQEFYDGVIFHRVISNFMIQSGDPTGTGSGGPGYSIEDEFEPSISNLKKTISMANTGQPNSGGSQFFINTKNNAFLDHDKPPYTSAHPVFGKVITGWDIVEAIENVPVNSNDRPLTPVVINMIRVTQPLSTSDFEISDTTFTIAPNPITQESIIEINSLESAATQFTIRNINGAKIATQQIQLNPGLNKINISDFQLPILPSGVYFMTVNNNKITTQKRFLVSE